MMRIRTCGALAALASIMALHSAAAAAAAHADLVELFKEFRALVPPPIVNGVPDYGPAAMREQHRALQALRARLDAMDDSSWPIAERVDYMIVLAEIRGLDFNHRVLKPWQRDPAFYSTTDLGFGPKLHGAISVPDLPLKRADVAPLAAKLRAVPAILEHARRNLTDASGDLARLAIVQKGIERNVYDRLARHAAAHHPSLVKPARAARDAVDRFIAWLEEIAGDLPPRGGIGKQEYDWYLRNVLLFPYTWDEMRIISEREYQRSIAFLKLEEHQNRGIPMPEPLTTRAEFDRRRTEADEEMIRYLREQKIMTTPDYLVPPGDGPYVLPAERRFTNVFKYRLYTKDQEAIKRMIERTWRKPLFAEIEDLKSLKVIVTFGNEALYAMTGRWGITAFHGRPMKALDPDFPYILPTIHPSSILRGRTAWKSWLIEDLQKAKRMAERTS